MNEVVQVTGWSRDNARRCLSAVVTPHTGSRGGPQKTRKPRPFKYSCDTRENRHGAWVIGLDQCGKHLVMAPPDLLDALGAHGDLAPGVDRYPLQTWSKSLEMSAATTTAI